MNSAKDLTLEQWMASFRNGTIMRGGAGNGTAHNGSARGAADDRINGAAADGRDDSADADRWETARAAAA